MKKNLLLVVFIFSVSLSFAQNSSWKRLDNKAVTAERIRQTAYSENQKLLQFNTDQFKQTLTNVPQRSSGQVGVEIQLPNIKGELERFVIWESSNFVPALQAQFPDIRAYVGKGITDPSAVLNFSFDPKGIQTMIFRANNGTEFIEPYTKDNSVYVVFDSATRANGQLPFTCNTEDIALSQEMSGRLNGNTTLSSAGSYKTMRLALSCTSEYTTFFGSPAGALAGMNATMTRCNGVFEKDLAVKLLMIDNTAIIFNNAATDPYSTAAVGTDPANVNNTTGWNIQLQNTLTSLIGNANYDIGHLFGASGGGGNAGCIGCVCVDDTASTTDKNKGSGYTSPADNIPQGDNFDIDYVVHEMGHQMGANHTFTHTTENNTVNVEPGSGTTIMAYAGVGTPDSVNIQAHSDDYFTFKSISQIQTNLGTKTCPISTNIATTNPIPVVSPVPAYVIPVGTAFKLVGNATGTAGEVLTYCWEQNNDATVVGAVASMPSPTKTDGPNFRSLPPTTSNTRYMPKFSDVLNGVLTTTWETVSTVPRSLNFSLTVRDNVLGGGQTASVGSAVTVVDGGGAFAITFPNVDNTTWDVGSTATVTWNVAGTTGNGINTANVNILLSTDGGATFSVLAANTPNDGSQSITVPSTASPYNRIMIEAVGNIFYAVSKNIGIGYTFSTSCTTYTNNTPLAIPDGVGANLPGATVSKTLNVPASGTISDVNVTIAGTHTYYWDLVVAVAHPDGTLSALLNRNCNANSTGFNVLFNDGAASAIVCAANLTGTFRPNTPLSAFNGKSMTGTWTLLANDNYNGDAGTLGNWSVEICALTPQLSTNVNQLTDFAIYPNPSKGNFNIQFENKSSNEISVNIYDMRGRIIFANKYSNDVTFNENIQLNNAQSGVYLVSITNGNEKLTKRLVIE
jgi:subtilisin-like proprotein convertase family protein